RERATTTIAVTRQVHGPMLSLPAPLRRHLLTAALLLTATPPEATVLFDNPGTLVGWDRVFTQQIGTVKEVTTPPPHQGTTSLEMVQTFQGINGTRYHSEVIKNAAQKPNTDVYHGQVYYL